ncbi:MAG: hypothetical protein JJE13_04280 [Thermoleophilia bacterium]|nr:hypothetical protein [Thermoleophilia bacterium]
MEILAEERLKRKGFDPEEIEKVLEAEFRSPVTRDRRFNKAWERLARISRTFPRQHVIPLIESAAIRRIPEVAWFANWFATHDGPGPQPGGLGTATALSLALEGGPPNFLARMKLFGHADALRGYAYDYIDVKKKTSAYEQWHKSCDRRAPDSVLHVSLALIKKLAKLLDDPNNKHRPRVGQYLVVDGTQQQADVRQVFPLGKKHAKFLDRDYEGLGYVRHQRGDGSELKRNHGYNIVVISDLATGLPLVWHVIPAGGDERAATIEMLEILFRIWPECPAEVLLGDSLYDHSIQFSRELEFIWNLHPLFTPHGSRSDSASEFAATNGVPPCPHSASNYMHLEKAEKFFNGLDGVAKGSARGEEPPNRQAFNRWVCPEGICKPINVYFDKDPRRNSYFPQAGDHGRYFFRAAAMPYRNSAESIFAEVKALLLFGPLTNRVRYAKTHREAMFAFGMAFMGLVAKRFAHEIGLYEEIKLRAESVGLLTPPSIDQPAPGPDHQQLAVIRELDPQDPPPPESFIDP